MRTSPRSCKMNWIVWSTSWIVFDLTSLIMNASSLVPLSSLDILRLFCLYANWLFWLQNIFLSLPRCLIHLQIKLYCFWWRLIRCSELSHYWITNVNNCQFELTNIKCFWLIKFNTCCLMCQNTLTTN